MRFLTGLLIVVITCSAGIAKETTLIDFKMLDQFEKEYTPKSFDGKIIIVLGADRKGSEYTSQWGAALGESLTRQGYIDSVTFVPLATLSAAPKMLRGMVKNSFPKEKDSWVLMDWDGAFADAYNFTPKKCNILVFDKKKNLVAHEAVTDVDDMALKKILDSILIDQTSAPD